MEFKKPTGQLLHTTASLASVFFCCADIEIMLLKGILGWQEAVKFSYGKLSVNCLLLSVLEKKLWDFPLTLIRKI